MKKFVIATSIPDESQQIDNKKVMDLITNTFKDGDNVPKDVVVMNLNNVSEEALNKFIDMGSIDCFAFTPETASNEQGRETIKKVLQSEVNLKKNTQFLNIYNGNSNENIQNSIALGNVMLQEQYKSKISHLDINSDERLISQNLKGMRNDALKTRDMLMEKEEDILGLVKNIVDRIGTEKDEYTSRHIRSVCSISEQVARKMDMSEEDIELLKIGALLHDVGKIDVTDEVLKKPAKLTDQEFFEMRMHVTFGEIELNQFDLGEYERAKVIASEHHERYDGRGYPRGLKGEEIDTLSRIVSIADATQAMFGRSYQSGRTKDSLIGELQKCSGVQFDPEMVDILCDILEKEPETIGVSYDEEGKISYDVKETKQLLEKQPTQSEKDDFFSNLKSGLNEDVEYKSAPVSSEKDLDKNLDSEQYK